MSIQTYTILVTALVTALAIGGVLFANDWLEKDRVRYANLGAQMVRNAVYSEALERGSARIDAVFEVELKEGEERKKGEKIETEVRSIMLYLLINQEE